MTNRLYDSQALRHFVAICPDDLLDVELLDAVFPHSAHVIPQITRDIMDMDTTEQEALCNGSVEVRHA